MGTEHHHISAGKRSATKCIDLYLDHDARRVRIVDTLEPSNQMLISAEDWNELIGRIKAGSIGIFSDVD